MSSSYHMKQKAFITASCIDVMLYMIGEDFFVPATFKSLWGASFETD